MTYALDMTRQAGPAFDVFNAVAVLLWMRHVSGEAPAEVGSCGHALTGAAAECPTCGACAACADDGDPASDRCGRCGS